MGDMAEAVRRAAPLDSLLAVSGQDDSESDWPPPDAWASLDSTNESREGASSVDAPSENVPAAAPAVHLPHVAWDSKASKRAAEAAHSHRLALERLVAGEPVQPR